ncbi:DNA-3-methyladenine glycosylase 2 [Entomohabitans teleogrylli]|uniref:DNA-3-methyladenine glycosylase 2 n=1 Tax=Entomohabitans teleogrylli TaxID=1384589 RepID=UPI00073DB00B|nr:DNA-3-methyladenine glycosylase 2 [Entomohabitans teleogrylli]
MLTCTLNWQGPYDWPWILQFLSARAVQGVEVVSHTGYQRAFALGEHQGVIDAVPDVARQQLRVTLSAGLAPVADEALASLRRLFDLDCEPAPLLETLGSLAAVRPGIRLPGCVDPFEQIVRAILGQLVSVAMAAKLTAGVVREFGRVLEDDPQWRLFPAAQSLARAEVAQLRALGMSLRRAQAIVQIARACEEGRFPLTAPPDVEQGMKQLIAFDGIGRWTASYFALRGWHARDVFLPDDYLIKQRFPGMTPGQIGRYARRWQPWRSYALLHIWNTADWQPDQ